MGQQTNEIVAKIKSLFFKGRANFLESQRVFPKTLFRYILSELLFSFFISFLFFFFIFFVNQILLMAQNVLEKQVPLTQVIVLILFSLPTIIFYSAPFACLVGTLMTVGRLTSDNEILVMLSSGFSYKTIFFPAIVLGITISLVSFFINDVLLPAGTIQFNKLWRQIMVSVPAVEMDSNSVKRFKETTIITGNVSDNIIEDIIILDRTNDGERRMILASSAELKDGGKAGLSLNLENSFIHSTKEIVREDYDYATMDLLQYWVSNEDIMQQTVSISAREMSSTDVRKAIAEKREALNMRINLRKNRVVSQAAALENILRLGSLSPEWHVKAGNIAALEREIQSVTDMKDDYSITVHVVELYRKFAVPFGAFCFIFLSVSIGLMAKKSGQATGFIIGVIISAIYWSMIFAGQMLSVRSGAPPFWSMWLANILSLSAGVILTVVRVRR